MRFYSHDIAIVSYAGVFPECDDEREFFELLMAGRCAIRDLTEDNGESPVQFKYHYSADKAEPNKSYARFGTQISVHKFTEWADRHGLDLAECTAFEIAMHELFSRLEAKTPGLFQSPRSECVIAMATGDPYSVRVRSADIIKTLSQELDLNAAERARIESDFALALRHPPRTRHLLKDYFGPLSYESVKERFGIQGPCAFVDAACASSLAALMVAVRRLKAMETDMVISGGIDFGLGILTLMAFSKVQVLSNHIMNPFDATADGMNQGEAAALFALMRLEDARAKGFPIHGVIRNCDGSSDGINGGLVEPTERGQILAYERAYKDVPLHNVTYMEGHGTGTVVGDKTELSSTGKFFHPLPVIGSVKANIGHTIGAAGSASLVKGLKIIEHRVIPPMPHFKQLPPGFSHEVNRGPVALPEGESIRIGISSFGFGGANFHMVVDEYRGEEPLSQPTFRPVRLVLNGMAEIDLEFVNELFQSSRIKIPPVSLPQYDPAIIGGALAAEKLFNDLNVKLAPALREQIGVLSTSNNFLERFMDCHDKAAYMEILCRLDRTEPKSERVKKLENILAGYLPITEDTFPGALNNLIAGKITKDFDLKGVNFHIAAETSALGTALIFARSLLHGSTGAFLIVHCVEEVSRARERIERRAVQAWLVSDLDFSLKADLPILSEFKRIDMRPGEGSHAPV